MPNYDYFCSNCGYKEEILQKMTDEPLKECPECQQLTFNRKIGMGIGLHFQGSGFYCTDYNRESAPPSNSGNESSENKNSSPPPSKPSNSCDCGKPSCS